MTESQSPPHTPDDYLGPRLVDDRFMQQIGDRVMGHAGSIEGGGGGGMDDLRGKVAALEIHVENIRSDVRDIKSDVRAFADIAREVGAVLLADISHPVGMAIAGAFPSPVGIADVVTFTTHKTLCGPRGAVILTTDEEMANKIDMAVFPGEQGGPHVNKFAAIAVAFKIAQTKKFRRLQERIVEKPIKRTAKTTNSTRMRSRIASLKVCVAMATSASFIRPRPPPPP